MTNSISNSMKSEAQARIDLAACFRWFARLNMHEAVANHFSASVSEDGSKFLINPKWQHFSTIKASDLILLDTIILMKNCWQELTQPHGPYMVKSIYQDLILNVCCTYILFIQPPSLR